MKKKILTAGSGMMILAMMGAGSASASKFFRGQLDKGTGEGGGNDAMTLEQVKTAVQEAAKALTDKSENASALAQKALEAQSKYMEELSKKASTEDIAKVKKELEDQKKELQDEMDEFRLKLQKGLNPETFASAIKAKFAEKATEIKNAYKNREAIEIEFKAVDIITTGSATQVGTIPGIAGVQLVPPSRANLRSTIVDQLVNKFTTSLAAYPYTETIPKDGDYAFVLEGAAKPEIDFKMETRWTTPVKLAAWVHLTEESVQDIPGLESIARGFLKDKHDIKKQRGILFGNGTAPNPKGATLYGRAFVAGDMTGKVEDPNFMDIVNAGITNVFTTHNYEDEMPYMPSLVLVNPVDFYLELVSAKDGFGHPLYPQASLFNRVQIGDVTILPDEMIPAGKIFIADMSKYNVSDYIAYVVKIGWINDDFIKNQFVMLGESRFHAFVKKLDEQAFIYDDIANIRDDISAPTT